MTTSSDLLEGRDDRFRSVIEAIDAANADDPETIEIAGEQLPKEQTHARMMCAEVLALDPAPTDLQLIAARAHHLRRWELPRTDYPAGRAGYLRWRTEQKRRHATAVGELMMAAGYGADEVERVGQLIRKQGLGTDAAVQVHEDALCLVFLQTQLDPVSGQLGDDKTVDVLVKTLRKMSSAGLAAAEELDLSDAGRRLLEAAVAGSRQP